MITQATLTPSCFCNPTNGLGLRDHRSSAKGSCHPWGDRQPDVNGGELVRSLNMPERKRYLGKVSVLFNSHSNTKDVFSEQAFKHPPKVVDRQCNKLEQDGGHMFPMFSSTDDLISPTSSFSALSHSSLPRAAALWNHHLPYCITNLPHKVSQANSQKWKCSLDAACCHGHHTLDMAVTTTVRLSQGPANTSINFQHAQMAALLHMTYRADTIFLCPPVTSGASSTVPRGSAVPTH